MAYLSKSDIEYITKNITPEETKYVTDLASTLYDTRNNSNISSDNMDDIIYITKLLAFAAKFSVINNTLDHASSSDYKSRIMDFKYIIEFYLEEIQSNIQSIIGVINKSDLNKIELPMSDNPLEIINELKICVNNWYTLHADNIEYEGCRYLTAKFLSDIHRFIYLFRLAKINQKQYIIQPDEVPTNNFSTNYAAY